VAQQAAQMQAILTLVAGGLGIALVPASMRRLRMEDVRFLDIVGARSPPTYRLAFAHADDNDNPIVRGFVATARRAMKDALRARNPA